METTRPVSTYKLERYSEKHRDEALADLSAELREFNHDGLTQLIEDLARHVVVRGSWTGCVISYKRGAAGSCRRDRLGRARNAFTVLYDNNWLTDEEVSELVQDELKRRQQLMTPTKEVEHVHQGTDTTVVQSV